MLIEYHERMMEPGYLAKLTRYPENPAGTALTEEMRLQFIDLMHAHGAAHFQIGKLYPHARELDPGALALRCEIKKSVDLDNLLSPGTLQL